jgi:hypothetical protein
LLTSSSEFSAFLICDMTELNCETAGVIWIAGSSLAASTG